MKYGSLLLLLGLGLVIGCGGVSGNTAKVKGKVLVGGEPMAGLTVLFQPETGRPATGTTNAAGEFTLTTFNLNDGALVGKHKVAISLDTSSAGPPPQPGTPEYDAAKTKAEPFDSKYKAPQTSGIEKEVVAGENDITIEVPKL
jgi:hypothetical protein